MNTKGTAMSALSSSVQKRLMQQARVIHGHAMTSSRQTGRDALNDTHNSGINVYIQVLLTTRRLARPLPVHPSQLCPGRVFASLLLNAIHCRVYLSNLCMSLRKWSPRNATTLPSLPLQVVCSYWKLNRLWGPLRGTHIAAYCVSKRPHPHVGLGCSRGLHCEFARPPPPHHRLVSSR